jgi:sorting nexin-29
LNVCYKILTNILHKRLEPYAEEILVNYQCGFRRGRSTTDQLFILRLVLEKAYEFGTDLHLLFSKSKAVPLHDMEAYGRRGGIAPTHS